MRKIIVAILLCAALSLFAGCSSSDGKSVKFSRGRWKGDVYTSDLFGIKITLDSECDKETDAVLSYRNDLENMMDAAVIEAIETTDTAVIEMFVNYHDKGNLILAYTKFEGATLDECVKSNADEMKTSGFFKNIKTDKVTVAGEEHPCLYATFVDEDSEAEEIMIFYKKGDYFAVITMSAVSEQDLHKMMSDLIG